MTVGISGRFFEKKAPQKTFAPRAKSDKSFFGSFFTKKELLPRLTKAP
jgi:hypothetical protein